MEAWRYTIVYRYAAYRLPSTNMTYECTLLFHRLNAIANQMNALWTTATLIQVLNFRNHLHLNRHFQMTLFFLFIYEWQWFVFSFFFPSFLWIHPIISKSSISTSSIFSVAEIEYSVKRKRKKKTWEHTHRNWNEGTTNLLIWIPRLAQYGFRAHSISDYWCQRRESVFRMNSIGVGWGGARTQLIECAVPNLNLGYIKWIIEIEPNQTEWLTDWERQRKWHVHEESSGHEEGESVWEVGRTKIDKIQLDDWLINHLMSIE